MNKERLSFPQEVREERISRGEFLTSWEEARRFWMGRAEVAVSKIRAMDLMRDALNTSLANDQLIKYYRETTLDDDGKELTSRIFFETSQKKKMGFIKE